jgi:tetratricopeptide (TPR) repeat protein
MRRVMSRWLVLLACGGGALLARAGDQPGLTPPADLPAPVPKVQPPKTGASASAANDSAPAVPKAPVAAAPAAPPFHHDESDIPDSIGAITVRPVPEAPESEPSFMKEVDYLKRNHDSGMAASYLEKVVTNPNLSTQDRALAILVLADCLEAVHRTGDELCWLKIWLQLYPARTEVGAVAYRMGALYTRMGLSDLARDSFYLALANAVNHGQVQGTADLERYTRLTCGTLWALAQNEYQAGNWPRAAELFDRFQHEAQSPPRGTLARAQYLQADCYYQEHDRDKATAAYTQALKDHPFHPLAPEGRLRLYHLDMMAKNPAAAQAELAALVWTVRTVWPKDEARWQKRTAELLLALNHNDADALPPLLRKSALLAAQDKAWQADLGHYHRLARLVATIPHDMPETSAPTPAGGATAGLSEQDDLAAMSRAIDALAPPSISAGKNP